MKETDLDVTERYDGAEAAAEPDVNLVIVLIILAVLVGPVALIVCALPTWSGSTCITVNVRN